jgi:hypothetical protein
LIPFTKARTEREAASDSLPSIEEGYGSGDSYVAQVGAAAEALGAKGLPTA